MHVSGSDDEQDSTCKRRSALLAVVQALSEREAVQSAGAVDDLHSRVVVKGSWRMMHGRRHDMLARTLKTSGKLVASLLKSLHDHNTSMHGPCNSSRGM